jgi:hypothetical protein
VGHHARVWHDDGGRHRGRRLRREGQRVGGRGRRIGGARSGGRRTGRGRGGLGRKGHPTEGRLRVRVDDSRGDARVFWREWRERGGPSVGGGRGTRSRPAARARRVARRTFGATECEGPRRDSASTTAERLRREARDPKSRFSEGKQTLVA